ncbi:DNA-methyltransferase [Lysinibacillus sp. UGB7]|uniref:DNA-methyltransferase n=1 Tax=Lysinibacillus sp. UGB7 TaxID=3411039 RepID=UPI003B779D28
MHNSQILKDRIAVVLKNLGRPASLKEISSVISDKPESTVRGRIYDNLDVLFKRISRGIYWLTDERAGVLLIEGDGRDLTMFDDESVDALVNDHPWDDPLSHVGGSRKFDNTYPTFRYEIEDFKEKARVLKKGGFCVEFLPSENANNWKYLFSIKEMAEQCGLLYYSKVTWIKGTFVSNTGRKSKNSEDVLILFKGPKARKLRLDKKKMNQSGEACYMSGTSKMLPTMFNIQSVPIRERVHQAEKPVELYKQLLELITKPGEIIVDQFAGSGNLGVAAIQTNRFACLFEIVKENIAKIQRNIEHVTQSLVNNNTFEWKSKNILE